MKETYTNPGYRTHERMPIDLYVNKIIGDEPHMARVRDISETGVFLYKLIEPETATTGQVGLEIKLPDSDNVIWAVGEVVREDVIRKSKKPCEGVALRFTRIAAHDRKSIADFVDRARRLEDAA